jgi:beta-phosphoglucomutase-like phosphatase (HAD superfamily)
VLGLPDSVAGCLFDLDGVLTQTAKIHAAAWKAMFDPYLRTRAAATDADYVPFDPMADYNQYVDGRPTYEGARAFLASRAIVLPQGAPSDPSHRETIDGLGNRKNELFLELIREHGVQPYEGSVRYLRAALGAGLRCAVVSSSTNARDVLITAGIAELFEVVIDGVLAEREHLAGKPVPDTFLAGARALGLEPAQAACLRTRSPARKPDGRDALASSSASTASTRPTRSLRTGRTWSPVTWPRVARRSEMPID